MRRTSSSRFGAGLLVSLAVAANLAACGSSKGTSSTHGEGGSGFTTSSGTGISTGSAISTGSGLGGGTASTGNGMGGGIILPSTNAGSTGSSMTQGFDVEPTPVQTVNVMAGMAGSPVTYTATLNGFAATNTAWGVDQGNLGTLSATTGSSVTFTPNGSAGGLVTITAALNGSSVQRQVMIQVSATQNGANTSNASEATQIPSGAGDLTAAGGVGGVGGTGLGTPVTDPATLSALASPTGDGSAQGLSFVYPYDKTVWPRGLPAPSLQWTWSPPGGAAYPGDADAVLIKLSTTNGSFTYSGTFARPAILSATGVSGNFINHPIPQDIWDMATNSAGGQANQLTASIVVAKNGVAYGPITETWTIAPARLPGIIYYQSYGTQLTQNYCCGITKAPFGGAVLSIHVGDTGPKIVAGQAGGTPAAPTGCRVCHSVAANGSSLISVNGDNESLSIDYAISATSTTPTTMAHLATYPAMYPDGTMALTPSGQLLPLPTDTTPITTTGLPGVDLGQPAFSADGTLLAYNNGQTLNVMAFDKTTSTFSGSVTVETDPSAMPDVKPGWPAFFPDGKSVVYHHQTLTGIENDLGTRAGNQAEIAWTSTTSAADVTALGNLNGVGYLPKLPAPSTMSCSADGYSVAASPSGAIQPNLDHSQDTTMNYEPTVNPLPSGGYAWVVFTSRRMYGNIATIPPFCSDPRGVDLTPNSANALATNITPKKLWVAAIDLTQAPGTDASHPAFYLPAQELLAGNARGFWTLDPCQADGTTCATGDQCCGGYCQANGDGGALICSNTQPMGSCSGVQDKCTTVADCCDPMNQCIGGFCTQPSPESPRSHLKP